jgi:predicted permease
VIRYLVSLWQSIFCKRQLNQEFDEELRIYVELTAAEKVQRGMTIEEALCEVRRELGVVEQVKQSVRNIRIGNWLETMIQDLRYAVRILFKNSAFSVVVVLTLALGIGANTAIFTVVNSILLRPLPFANPGELVTWTENESLPDVDDIRRQSTSFFIDGGGLNPESMDYSNGTEPLGVHAGFVDAGFFRVFGVPPMLGRTLSTEDDRQGGPHFVVLANSFWQNHLGSDPRIVGKTITLGGNQYEVIGVMPDSFNFPDFKVDVFVSLWVAYPEAAVYRGVHFMQTYWRLRPGVSLQQAQAGMMTINGRMAALYPSEEKGRQTMLIPLQLWMTGDIRRALLVLFGAVCVVLLIACANYAGLLTARNVGRRREMMIRAALGGGKRRLIRQALTENLLLSALGGVAGMLLAELATHLLVAAKPTALAHQGSIAMDMRVFLFGIGLSILIGLIFGWAPALSTSRVDLSGALREEGQNSTSGLTGNTFRKILVGSQIALALVLLAGAGLLVKSFLRLNSIDPGFKPDRVIELPIQLPAKRYNEIPRQTLFRREILGKLNRVPGVQAAIVSDVPMNGGRLTHLIAFEGRPPVAKGDEPEVDTFCVMGDYFRVMQIPVRSGRALTEMDREDHPLVAVINQALARKFYGDRNPIGQRIHWARESGSPQWMTIVGVVGDVKQYSLAKQDIPAVFAPFAQSDEAWRRWMSVVIRMPGDSANLIPVVKREIWSADGQIPLDRIESMDGLLGVSLSEHRFNMSMLGLFAGLALVLAAIGIYGLISYSVTERTREIGIRVAVGASRSDVMKIILGQGMRIAAVGLSAGLLGASVMNRVLARLLFEVSPTDPTTFATVVLLILIVVLLACSIPALRATKVDPIAALRYE